MAQTYSQTFYVEPRGWQRVARNKHGAAYVPAETRYGKAAIRWLAQKEFKLQRFEDAIRVEITAFIERPKSVKREYPSVKPDIDNVAKLVLDSLNGLVWRDDAQIVTLIMQKRYCVRARIELTVSECLA